MKLLLDTHIFLWYISADSRLPAVFRDAIHSTAYSSHKHYFAALRWSRSTKPCDFIPCRCSL